MATVRILLGIVWLAAIGSSWGTGSSNVVYAKASRIVTPAQTATFQKANRLLDIARKEIGVKEKTSNSSPQIDAYNAYVGFKAVPWCASFVSYCFGKAGFTEPRTAWSPGLFPKDRLAKDPVAGMVMGIYFDNLKRVGHCGLVERVKGSWISAIEGNTNNGGERDGDGVYRKLRHLRTVHCYADWITANPKKKGGTL
jgi:hypothetical protein